MSIDFSNSIHQLKPHIYLFYFLQLIKTQLNFLD